MNLFNWRVFLLVYAPVLLWLGVIFTLSSGAGSASETSRIIGPLIKFFLPTIDDSSLQAIHSFVRKAAHVTEYAILAALAVRVALSSNLSWITQSWPVLPFFLVIVTASLDEINQSYNSQRTGSIWDVLLDVSGGSIALALIWLVRRARRRHNPDKTK